MKPSFIITASLSALAFGGLVAACDGEVLENGGVGGGTDGSTTIATGQGGATSASTTTGGPVTCPNPNYTDLVEDECALLDRSSCTEPGTGCVPENDGTTACVYGGGLKDVQATCTENAECKPGLVCAFDRCSRPCCRETNEPCGAGECNVEFTFDANFVYYCSYLDSCTPFGEPCPSSQGCVPRFAEGDAVCVGLQPDGGGDGDGCQFINDCQLNLVCDRDGVPDVCRYMCKTDGSSTTPGEGGCPMGQTCQPEGTLSGIGVCRP